MTGLRVLIDGNLVGTVGVARAGGRLSFTYETNWRESAQRYALTLSMPLADTEYRHRAVLSYLWNLLPENPAVLQRWGQQFHVSAANPAKLLAHVGEDVSGAAQFIPPDRLDEIQKERQPNIEWMTMDEVAVRLRELRADISAIRRPGDLGKMSLPGAQAKTAYCRDEITGRWGLPAGRAPTTHIFKPCIPGYDGLVENEHLCQDIASRLGLRAARSFVLALDQTYIVVERYDRLPPEKGSAFYRRVHQEDLCQALGLMPGRKYQEDGGPGIAQIVKLIRRVSAASEEDVERFLKANMYNWLIGGTDAHAKNYSFLISGGDAVRLAPLYDISSQLPYTELIPQKLSMKIGEHYDVARIDVADWRSLAQNCAVDEERMLAMLIELARAMPDHVAAARDQALADGLAPGIVAPLAEQLIAHSEDRLASLAAPRSLRKRVK